MKTDSFDFCLCGHIAHEHLHGTNSLGELSMGLCRECGADIWTDKMCYEFKLDNLAYVERLAKKKKLI